MTLIVWKSQEIETLHDMMRPYGCDFKQDFLFGEVVLVGGKNPWSRSVGQYTAAASESCILPS